MRTLDPAITSLFAARQGMTARLLAWIEARDSTTGASVPNRVDDTIYGSALEIDTGTALTANRPYFLISGNYSGASFPAAEECTGLRVEMELEKISGDWGGMLVRVEWFANGTGGTDGNFDVFPGDVLASDNGLRQTLSFDALADDVNFVPGSAPGVMLVKVFGTTVSQGHSRLPLVGRVHRINVQVITQAASSYIQQQAISDLKGNAAASCVMRVKAGGAQGEVEIVAADDPINGPASQVKMTASEIVLDGDVIVPRSLPGDRLLANAITAAEVGANEIITDAANMRDATITNAKIVDLDAAKIAAGTTISGTVLVEGGRSISEIESNASQSKALNSMVALGPRIAWRTDTVYYATHEPDTVIWKNGTIAVNATSRQAGTLSVNAGDVIEVSKPCVLMFADDNLLTPLAAGTYILDRWSRNDSLTYYLYATTATTVTITVGSGAAQTVTVPANTLVTHVAGATYSTTEIVSIRSDAPVMVARDTLSKDACMLWPVDVEYMGRLGAAVSETGTETTRTDGSGTGVAYAAFSDGGSLVAVGDGSGNDGEFGAPLSALATHYVMPFDLSDYEIAAVEPTVVAVYDNTGAVYATYDLSAASRDNPLTDSVGAISGVDAPILTAGAYFVGTAPFFVRANNPETNEEFCLLGWREDLRGALAPQSIGSATANIAQWAEDPASRINAGVTNNDPGRILISGSATLDDWSASSDATLIEGGKIATGSISAGMGIFSGPLQSDDFVSGSTGWQITKAGDAEFNQLIVRNFIVDGAVSDGGSYWQNGSLKKFTDDVIVTITNGAAPTADALYQISCNVQQRPISEPELVQSGTAGDGVPTYTNYEGKTRVVLEERKKVNGTWQAWTVLNTGPWSNYTGTAWGKSSSLPAASCMTQMPWNGVCALRFRLMLCKAVTRSP